MTRPTGTAAPRARRAFAFAAFWLFALCLAAPAARAQKPAAAGEHDEEILGVRVGMSVPEALQAVYEHTATSPAPQRPDALKEEGKEKRDVRVVYRGLKEGELQIVFAGGKAGFVREVWLTYAKQPTQSDLRLPQTGSIASAGDVLNSSLNSGEKVDDRYSIGFTDDKKTERFWWRDGAGRGPYAVRVGFVSGDLRRGGANAGSVVARKVVMVRPGDEEKFWKAVSPK